MQPGNLLPLWGLVLMVALPAGLAAQTVVVKVEDPPQAATGAVVGLSSSLSSREARLAFQLSGGGTRVIALRGGAVLVDGERVASYSPESDLDREWRALVARLGTMSPDEAVAAARNWAVRGTFGVEEQAALKAITAEFARLTPVEAVPSPAGPPAEVAEAMAAAAAAREDAGALADRIRASVRDRIDESVRMHIANAPVVVDVAEPEVRFASPFGTVLAGLLGLGGAFLALCAIAFGTSFFAGRQIDVMADTVSTSFARSFFVGLLAQPLILPAFGAMIVGLTLTVVGILLIPVAIVAFAATLAAAVIGGYLAVARVAGSAVMRRRLGRHDASVLGLLQSFAWGLAIILAVWLPAVLLWGWVPVAGDALAWLAAMVTWALITTGFGAAVLTRGGVRTTFGRRFRAPELPPATLFEEPGPEISTAEWMAQGRKS